MGGERAAATPCALRGFSVPTLRMWYFALSMPCPRRERPVRGLLVQKNLAFDIGFSPTYQLIGVAPYAAPTVANRKDIV